MGNVDNKAVYGYSGEVERAVTTAIQTGKQERCNKCNLFNKVKFVKVESRGNYQGIALLIVGEAPGRQEDEQGVAFIGDAGKLLDECLEQAKVPKDVCRMTNVVRCAPYRGMYAPNKPKIGTPNDDEIKACIGYLWDEIEEVKPKIIVALGKIAINAILPNLPSTFSVTSVRGKIKEVNIRGRNWKIMPTFHPAAVLHGTKGAYWQIISDLRDSYSEIMGGDSFEDIQYSCFNDGVSAIDYIYKIREMYEAGDITHIALDIETDSEENALDPFSGGAKITGVSMSYAVGQGVFIPIDHRQSGNDRMRIIDALHDLATTGIPVICHNAKFDLKFLKVLYGFTFHLLADTMLMSHLLYGELRSHDLESLARDFVGYTDWKTQFSNQRAITGEDIGQADLGILGKYAAYDAEVLLRLYEVLKKQIDKFILEIPHLLVTNALEYFILNVESDGVFIDTAQLQPIKKNFLAELSRSYGLMISINSIRDFYLAVKGFDPVKSLMDSGYIIHADGWIADGNNESPDPQVLKDIAVFNPDSTEQITEIVCKGYGVVDGREYGFHFDPVQMTKTGPSMDKGAIEVYMDICRQRRFDDELKFFSNLQIYKRIAKLYNSYVKNMPRYFRAGTNNVSVEYELSGTSTGRLSSHDMSLHLIPRGSVIKKLFISRWKDYGGVLAFPDYSQLELRVLAAMSKDQRLLDAFAKKEDIHSMVAAWVFDKESLVRSMKLAVLDAEYRAVCTASGNGRYPKALDSYFVDRIGGMFYGRAIQSSSDVVVEKRYLGVDTINWIYGDGARVFGMGGDNILRCISNNFELTDLVTKDERQFAKSISFGIVYGISAEALSNQTGISIESAKTYLKMYFNMFTGVKSYIDKIHLEAKKFNMVRSPVGRIRHIYSLKSGTWSVKQKGLRQSQNTPIQSAASDIGLLAISLLLEEFYNRGLRSRLYGFVHDSILVDVAPRELNIIIPLQMEIMEHRVKKYFDWIGGVPLEVDYGVGVNWGSQLTVNFFDNDPFTCAITGPKEDSREFREILSKSITDGYGMKWKQTGEDEKVISGNLTYGRVL